MSQRRVWFTSDFHIGHKKICEYTDRPWSAEENVDSLIALWNDVVKDGDMVYHLRDYSCCPKMDASIVIDAANQLKGDITFIMGNHDSRSILEQVRHTDIVDYLEVKHAKQRIILSHYPMVVWSNCQYGSWMLYGHCHGSYQNVGKSMDVGIDNSYNLYGEHRLFSFDDVKAFMDARQQVILDYHSGVLR
jgi:calcineurin-like phosphoesterase family protein